MNGHFEIRRAITALAVLAMTAVTTLAAAVPATAASLSKAASAATSCPSYPVFQPFLAWGDTNDYVLLPGETADDLTGSGWELMGGARLVTTDLEDGQVGQVLDMPAGSAVITPPLCVDGSSFPAARTMIAEAAADPGPVAAAVTPGVAVAVEYQSLDGTWAAPLVSGTVTSATSSWGPSALIALHSQTLTGDNLLRLALAATGGTYELYNFFVDPRRSH